MSIRWTQKPQVNIKLETGKFKQPNNRERSFITNCVKELKEKGYTICWEQWQVDEIIKLKKFIIKEIVIEDGYFIIKI